MATRTYTKDDVETRDGSPAVNVKVRGAIFDAFRTLPDADLDNPHFTDDWVERHLSEDNLENLFWHICEYEFEQVQSDADDIFGPHVQVYRDGRSGGWAVVDGLPDVEDWGAVALAKWRKFERLARQIADDVPYQMLASIYLNEFRAWVEA